MESAFSGLKMMIAQSTSGNWFFLFWLFFCFIKQMYNILQY
jgi:hypothetical protein